MNKANTKNHLKGFFGKIRLGDITKDTMKEWFLDMNQYRFKLGYLVAVSPSDHQCQRHPLSFVIVFWFGNPKGLEETLFTPKPEIPVDGACRSTCFGYCLPSDTDMGRG
jgi:hypothetical protein